METLTDFATVQYFGVDTVSVGVFRIWRGTYDRDAASEIATLVLGVRADRDRHRTHRARGRARFGQSGGAGAGIERRRLGGWRAVMATATCGAVVVVAFIGPVVQLTVWAIREQTSDRGTPLLDAVPELPLATAPAGGGHGRASACSPPSCSPNAQRFGRRSGHRLVERGPSRWATPFPARWSAIGVILAAVAARPACSSRSGSACPGPWRPARSLVLVYAYCRPLPGARDSVRSKRGSVRCPRR